MISILGQKGMHQRGCSHQFHGFNVNPEPQIVLDRINDSPATETSGPDSIPRTTAMRQARHTERHKFS
jgi:hypothetical protein